MAVDYSKYHSILDSYEPYQPPAAPDAAAPKQNTSTLADFGTDLKRGVQQVPSAITGLLDIPVAAVTGRPMVSEGWDELGKLTGFQPKKWSDEAQAEYSPARQDAQRQAAQAEGFVDTAGVYLSNPSMLAGTVLESVPSIALGGIYARGLKGIGALSGVTRAGIGEGAVMGGQSMNQMVEDGADPRTAAGFAAGVGAIGGALGVVGGSLAQRMGLIDPDSLAAGVTRTANGQPMGLARRVAGGAVSEGLFEELPQTMVETVAGNLAAERAWDEDLGKNAAVGLLAGGLMGGVVNIPGARRPRDLTQDAPQGEQTVEPSALEAALRTDTVPVQQWIDQQLNIGASPSETRKNAQAAFQGKIEPQLILDENGTPKTTTSAFDVYEFQRDFDARVAKRGGLGQTTAAPQADQPIAQDTDPAVSSLRDTQYAKQIFKQDGAMRQNAERAWQAYRGFSGAEIDAAIEELAPNPGAAWRIAMLETIRDQRVQQAQPEVQDGQPAKVDAAGDQRQSAVAGGSAGDVSGQPDVGNGVRQPAGAPAPSSAAGVPVGAAVAQSPASVEARQKLAGLQAFAQQVGSNVSADEISALPEQEVARLYDMLVDAQRLNAEVGSGWTQTAQNWIEGAVRSSIASQALGRRVENMKARAKQFDERSAAERAAREVRKKGAQPDIQQHPAGARKASDKAEKRARGNFVSSNEFSVDTEDSGTFDVTVHRTPDGEVVILHPDGLIEHNAAFASSKTDAEILAYEFEPVGFKGATPRERQQPTQTPAARGQEGAQGVAAQTGVAPPARPTEDTPEARAAYIGELRGFLNASVAAQPQEVVDAMRAVFGGFRQVSDVASALMNARNGLIERHRERFGAEPDAAALRKIDAQLAKLHKQMSENADDPVTSSLRAAARDLGVSHETVRTRMNKGVAALQQAATEAGIDIDAALEMTGVKPSAVLAYMDSISEAEAAQMGLSYRRSGPRTTRNAGDDAFNLDDAGADYFEQGLGGAVDEDTQADAGVQDSTIDAQAEASTNPADEGIDFDALASEERGRAERVAERTTQFSTELDHKGLPLQPVDFEDAASDYDLMADEGDTPFAELPRQIQVQWVKAWVAAQDGALTEQQLVRVFSEIADQYAPEAQTVEPGTPGTSEAVPANARGESESGAAAREEVTDTVDSRTAGLGDGNRFSRNLTDTQAFKDWFGDSKMVSRDGTPLLFMHGSPQAFDAFSNARLGSSSSHGSAGLGHFFTRDQSVAERYADGGNIYKGWLAIQRPYRMPLSEAQSFETAEESARRREQLRRRGHDGVVILDDQNKPWAFVAFEPWQFKSTDNRGTFDAFDDGFRRSAGGATQGTTVESVRTAINAIATPAGRRKITVVQSADELVERGVLNSNEARGTQGFVDGKGNAYFIAENIPQGSELAVVLHEIGAHIGIENLLTPQQYENLTRKIFDWAQSDGNGQEARIARAALARVDAANLTNDADIAPETIAYFIEEAVKAGVNPTAMQYKTELGRWFRTLWAAFKVALRRLNLINADKLTAQNVVDLAYGAARVSLAGQYHGTAANFRRFDHRFMGSGEGAQAFGWGTYLAQRFGIANEYFEADVRRKDRGGDQYPTYDGERLPDPFAVDTSNPTEIAKNALSLVNGGVMPNPRVYLDSLFVDDSVASEALAVYQTLDPKKLGWVKDGRPEGNIHITDVNATEDELLDWDKPLSEQSEVVKAALARVGIAPRGEWNPTGMNLYRTLQTDEDRLDDAGFEATDRGASEYLDSLGIKGIKFLDAKSRGPRYKYEYVADVEYGGLTHEHAAAKVDLDTGKIVALDSYSTEARARAAAVEKDSLYAKERDAPRTRNLVIFNDANIYRVGSMRGGPVDKGGRMMFSKAVDPQLAEQAQEVGSRVVDAIKVGMRKGWTGLAFSADLANAAYRAGIKSARALDLVSRKKATRAHEIQIEVEAVLSQFADLKSHQRAVEEFVYKSTLKQKWGFKPDWKSDAVVDPTFEAEFNKLPKAAQDVVKAVFRHGDTVFRKKQTLLRRTIASEYENLIAAEKDDAKRRSLEKQRDKELREAGRLMNELEGPYAPLRRYGEYVVVAKSQKYRDTEAAGQDTSKLKADPKHYVVEFAETRFEADKRKAELARDFGDGVWAGEKEAAMNRVGEMPFMLVQRLRKMVDSDLDGELNTKSKRVLNKLLVDLYISTLHEANARHSEQRRRYVAGASNEMMRAFATQGRADSHLLSSLEFNDEIVSQLQNVREEAKRGAGDPMLKTRLRNEILQRHMMDLDFEETPLQDKLMSLNSFWMLLTSPAYYVQNATQVFMMTMPAIAAKHNLYASSNALVRASREAWNVLRASSWNEAADLSKFKGTQGERDMLTELQARGTLDFGISAELGYWETRGEVSKVFNQVMRKVGMATRKLEVLNRMSSALAAYRLEYDKASGTDTERHAKALEYADKIIKDTHGDYSTANAPRYLRMLPKVMTQFRKFQLIQLSLFAKNVHSAFIDKGVSADERKVARAALGYLFLNHTMMAGAVGMPASALVGMIYAALAGDDDDPADWEVDVRRAIGDKELADLILHGLPSLVNINMSNKIGAGTMLSPLPFAQFEGTRDGYNSVVVQAMGPLIGGLGPQVWDAVGRMADGDVAQGAAQLLPRGLRDAARGLMASQEGVKLRNGQTALKPEELTFYDSLMMTMGLPTLKTTSRTETQFKAQQYEQFFRERVTRLKREYTEAYEENDRAAMQEARDGWVELQASRKELGFKVQPLSDLLKAPREKAKAERKLESGVRTTEQARGFVQSLQ